MRRFKIDLASERKIESTYSIEKQIGKGGFGEVYVASGPGRKKVALKKQGHVSVTVQAQVMGK